MEYILTLACCPEAFLRLPVQSFQYHMACTVMVQSSHMQTRIHSQDSGGVFAQRGHSAHYYVVYPGNTPENHPPAEAGMGGMFARRAPGTLLFY